MIFKLKWIYGVFMYMRCPESQQPSTTFQYWSLHSPALTAGELCLATEIWLWKIYLFRISSHVSVLYYLIQTWVINAKAIITTGQYSQQYNVCKTYFYMHNVFYCLLFLGLSPNFNFCYCSFPFIFTPSFLYFTFQFRVSWI